MRGKFINGVITFGVALLLVRLPLATRAQVEVETKVRGLYYNYDYAYQVRYRTGSPASEALHRCRIMGSSSG